MKSCIFAVTVLVFLFLVPFLPHSAAQDTVNAKTLFENKCNVCHSANRAKSTNKTNEEWTKTVTRMKAKTGMITTEEARLIIDYLTKTYGK